MINYNIDVHRAGAGEIVWVGCTSPADDEVETGVTEAEDQAAERHC